MGRVARVDAEGFGVDAGGDHEGGVGVATVVQPDRIEAGGRPGFLRSRSEPGGVERAATLAGEGEALPASPLMQPMSEQVNSEYLGDRDLAVAGSAFSVRSSPPAYPRSAARGSPPPRGRCATSRAPATRRGEDPRADTNNDARRHEQSPVGFGSAGSVSPASSLSSRRSAPPGATSRCRPRPRRPHHPSTSYSPNCRRWRHCYCCRRMRSPRFWRDGKPARRTGLLPG
jgi:hypothetical protein